jgi:hypothetical protein
MSAMSVYRAPPTIETEEPPPRELVVEMLDRASTQSGAAALFKIVVLPGVVAAFLTIVWTGAVGVVGMAIAMLLVIRSLRRAREQAVLSVDAGKLTIASRSSVTTLPLWAVEDVELDIKKIQRVLEGSSAIPGMRLVESTVGPEIDTARIVIVAGTGRTHLSEQHIAHIDAIDSLGKIRLFLRKHGWLPQDERSPDPHESADDDDDAESASYRLGR